MPLGLSSSMPSELALFHGHMTLWWLLNTHQCQFQYAFVAGFMTRCGTSGKLKICSSKYAWSGTLMQNSTFSVLIHCSECVVRDVLRMMCRVCHILIACFRRGAHVAGTTQRGKDVIPPVGVSGPGAARRYRKSVRATACDLFSSRCGFPFSEVIFTSSTTRQKTLCGDIHKQCARNPADTIACWPRLFISPSVDASRPLDLPAELVRRLSRHRLSR